MKPWRVLAVALGLAFFLVVAILAGVMGTAVGSMKPLGVMWLFTPAPLVFVLLTALRPRRALRIVGASYLGASGLLTIVVLLGVGWIGSERAIHPAQCEDMPNLAEYPTLQAKVQDVRFKSEDGVNLSGWFIPGERKTSILVLHGYRCARDEMLPHADILNRAGYSVLLFDFRSRGRSEGDAVTLSYFERGDVLGAIAYLKTRTDIDTSGFGVLGISQGGATAIRAAAASPDLKAVVSECPFKSLDSVIGQSFTHFIHLPAFPFAPITVWMAERRVGIKSEDVVPEREVVQISPRPVFIMHGALDETISPKDGEAVYAAAREPKQWWLIPGSAHAQGAEKEPAEYERRVVEFFNANLK